MTDVESVPLSAEPRPPRQSAAIPPGMLVNGVKLAGETVLPGASLLLDGKVANGLVHTLLGFGARAALGPVGLLIVAADSFSKSVTDKHLWAHLSDAADAARSREQAPSASDD